MEKIKIYTNEQCPYCRQIKGELSKQGINFEECLTKDWMEEWQAVVDLTGMTTVPTISYGDNYFIPNRDFGNPQGLINLLENFKESKFSESRQIIERTKTLNTNIMMAFQRMDSILKKIEAKLKIEE